MDIKLISAGANPPKDIHVVIEIPLGGVPVKYEIDKASGALFVDRFLHTAMFYPGNYGFIPHTLSGDGDPCDVLVASQVPVVPGAVIRCRPVGALVMEDEAKQPLIILMHGDCTVSTKNLAREIGAKSVQPCQPEVANRHYRAAAECQSMAPQIQSRGSRKSL